MAYIGSIPADKGTGSRVRDEFTADGTQVCFALSVQVPGSFESNVIAIVDNVIQQPVSAYTIVDTVTLTLTGISGTFTLNETVTGGTSGATAKVIKVNTSSIVVRVITGTFATSETITGGTSSATATTSVLSTNVGQGINFTGTPTSGSFIYILHQAQATYNLTPAAGSVTPESLSENLRSFTVDTFTATSGQTAFTLSVAPISAKSILAFVDGVMQTVTSHYTLSGTTLTMGSGLTTGQTLTVVHLGFSTVARTAFVDGSVTTAMLADGSITSAKIADGTVIAADVADGTITPAKLTTGKPLWDSSSNLTVSGNLTLNGTGKNFVGDFTNATVLSRNSFQTSTANSTTGIYALPSGSSTAASWQATNNSDPTNASKVLIATNGSTDVQLVSGRNGTGTYLPLSFYTNGSQQMQLDTAGKLGIGTAPSSVLNVAQSSAGDSEFRLQQLNTGGYATAIRMWTAGSTGTSYNYIESYDSTNSVQHWAIGGRGNAQTICLSTGGAERVRVDSGGRMTMGYQPRFYAWANNTSMSSGNKIAYDTAPLNIGNCFNTTTNTFTAPVAGTYFFSAVLRYNQNGVTYDQTSLYVNGAVQYQSHYLNSTAQGSGYTSTPALGLVTLAAGDTVYVWATQSGGGTISYSGAESSFFGWLVA